VLLCCSVVVLGQVIKVLPFGDSNTQGGFLNQGSYRTQLGLNLKGDYDPVTTQRYLVNFVGSQYNYGDHEGHSGWKTTDLNGIADWVLTRYQPDIILLMIGTNDFYFNFTVAQTYANYNTLLSSIFSASPKVKILASAVPHINATRCASYIMGPCPLNMEPNIEAFNLQLPNLIQQYVTAGHDIYFVNMPAEAGFVPSDYWTWGIHFNVTGYAKMANVWTKHLIPLINQTAFSFDYLNNLFSPCLSLLY